MTESNALNKKSENFTVDNLYLDGNSLISTAGNLELTPFAGSSAIIDSHWGFDNTTMTAQTDNNTIVTAYAGKNVSIESVTFDGGIVTATTVNATTFDTNVAAAGVTIAGTTIASDGTDANIDITMTPKGSGTVNPSALSVNSAYTFPTTDGTANYVLSTDGAGTASWAINSAVGKLIQVVTTNTTAKVDCTTVLPLDDTIPQNDEGTEVLTLAITPTNVSSKLLILFNASGSTQASVFGSGAIFQDATVNALSAQAFCGVTDKTATGTRTMVHIMTAGTTSETTIKVRIGPFVPGTVWINGGAASYWGGVGSCTLTIMEIQA